MWGKRWVFRKQQNIQPCAPWIRRPVHLPQWPRVRRPDLLLWEDLPTRSDDPRLRVLTSLRGADLASRSSAGCGSVCQNISGLLSRQEVRSFFKIIFRLLIIKISWVWSRSSTNSETSNVFLTFCLPPPPPPPSHLFPPGHVCAGGGGDDGGVPAGRPPADAAVHHEQEPIAGGGKGPTLSAVHRGDHC